MIRKLLFNKKWHLSDNTSHLSDNTWLLLSKKRLFSMIVVISTFHVTLLPLLTPNAKLFRLFGGQEGHKGQLFSVIPYYHARDLWLYPSFCPVATIEIAVADGLSDVLALDAF